MNTKTSKKLLDWQTKYKKKTGAWYQVVKFELPITRSKLSKSQYSTWFG